MQENIIDIERAADMHPRNILHLLGSCIVYNPIDELYYMFGGSIGDNYTNCMITINCKKLLSGYNATQQIVDKLSEENNLVMKVISTHNKLETSPRPRRHAIICHDPRTNSIYVSSGVVISEGKNYIATDLWRFDIDTITWIIVEKKITIKRFIHMEMDNGVILFFNQANISEPLLGYCTCSGVLSIIPVIRNGLVNIVNYSINTRVDENGNRQLVLFGGKFKNEISNSIWLFSFSQREWTMVLDDSETIKPIMPIILRSCMVMNDYLMIHTSNCSNPHYDCFSFITGKWTVFPITSTARDRINNVVFSSPSQPMIFSLNSRTIDNYSFVGNTIFPQITSHHKKLICMKTIGNMFLNEKLNQNQLNNVDYKQFLSGVVPFIDSIYQLHDLLLISLQSNNTSLFNWCCLFIKYSYNRVMTNHDHLFEWINLVGETKSNFGKELSNNFKLIIMAKLAKYGTCINRINALDQNQMIELIKLQPSNHISNVYDCHFIHEPMVGLLKSIQSIYHMGILSDIKINVAGNVFYLHKSVLSMHGEYFAGMFSFNEGTGQEMDTIKMDVCPVIFEKLVALMYGVIDPMQLPAQTLYEITIMCDMLACAELMSIMILSLIALSNTAYYIQLIKLADIISGPCKILLSRHCRFLQMKMMKAVTLINAKKKNCGPYSK